MHPSILERVHSTLYPKPEDKRPSGRLSRGWRVEEAPVLGFNYIGPEDRPLQLHPTSTSHIKALKVEMKVALVQHRPSPTTNDQQAVFAEECVYPAAVDHFQGEEAKVAIISVVRSYEQQEMLAS
ncbi:uncharacterized protein PG986_002470 [Apiospora aurea]|uniref:DNA2/NAM7 helicase-like C-terminal domain-containing protein n=1 Tax=Apiospora aurea TaxID=335848 RepID=A0ABR1QP57_9PEZI